MTQTQSLDNVTVRIKLLSFHVVQDFASSDVQRVQPTLGMSVLFVLAQMGLNLLDPSG